LYICFISPLCKKTFTPSNFFNCLSLLSEKSILCAWYFSYFLFLTVYEYLFHFISVQDNFLSIILLVLSLFTIRNIYSLCMLFLSFILLNCISVSFQLCARKLSLHQTSCTVSLYYQKHLCAWYFSYFFSLLVYLLHFLSVQDNFLFIKLFVLSLFTIRNTYSLCTLFPIFFVLILYLIKHFSPSDIFYCLSLLSETSILYAWHFSYFSS
jgi:hypothetical protein